MRQTQGGPAGILRNCLIALLCVVSASDGRAAEDLSSSLRDAVCSRSGAELKIDCLKLELVGLAARSAVGTDGTSRHQILPGVYITHSVESLSRQPSPQLIRSVKEEDENSTEQLEHYISETVREYLSSVTLSVKVLDPNTTIGEARQLSERLLNRLTSSSSVGQSGRRKGGGYGGAAVWGAGMVAAVGMSALAAMAGKALMTSTLALMMAGATALRGGGAGGGGGGDGGGCKSAATHHYIDAHGRAIAVERVETGPVSPIYRAGANYK